MDEITSSVTDPELIEHWKNVIAPYIREVQIPEHREAVTGQRSTQTPGPFMNTLTTSMENAIEGLTPQQVNTFWLSGIAKA